MSENGSIETDQTRVAMKFNKYYTNVASQLLNDLGKANTKYQDYLKNPNESTLFLKETDHGEILKLLSSLDTSKAGDIYSITPKLLKCAKFELVENLTKMFNKSLKLGIFPDPLKLAKVIPIHKDGSRLVVSNYRPISLLPILGKIFERIIYTRLYGFVEKYKIITNNQYGFQRNKSTEHALIDIHEKILHAIENKETPCCVFLDFAKAFDTVNHQILLRKLEHYGIRGLGNKLLQSYLTNRQQCVSVAGSNSKLKNIEHGVPQGSILGPLLFLIYINDICESSSKLSFFLFADDTTLFYSHKDTKVIKETFNRELITISDWLKANKLSLNVKKN